MNLASVTRWYEKKIDFYHASLRAQSSGPAITFSLTADTKKEQNIEKLPASSITQSQLPNGMSYKWVPMQHPILTRD